jgi:hypothetical protein
LLACCGFQGLDPDQQINVLVEPHNAFQNRSRRRQSYAVVLRAQQIAQGLDAGRGRGSQGPQRLGQELAAHLGDLSLDVAVP